MMTHLRPERTPRRDGEHRLGLALLSLLGLLGCGGPAPPATTPPPGGGTGTPGGVDVSGIVINHSMNRLASELLGRTTTLSDVAIEIIGQQPAVGAAAEAALATGPLDTGQCVAMGGCPFAHAGIDASPISAGLAARLRDTRAGTAQWVTTATGIASGAQLAALAGAGQPLTTGRAFAVTRDAIDAVIAPMAGLSGDEVLARGVVFGLVYGAARSNGSNEPIVGATVSPSSADVTIVYPGNTFRGTASATTNQGAFLAIPRGAGPARAVTFQVTAPSGVAFTWDPTQAAVLSPGAMFFLLMEPK